MKFCVEILWLDSYFNPISIYTLGSENRVEKKMILIILFFYPSLHSNPRNPPVKAFILSLFTFFSSLSIRLPEGKGEEHWLMLNLVVVKGASKDRDQSKLSITLPRTSTPTRFVQRSKLDFGLITYIK